MWAATALAASAAKMPVPRVQPPLGPGTMSLAVRAPSAHLPRFSTVLGQGFGAPFFWAGAPGARWGLPCPSLGGHLLQPHLCGFLRLPPPPSSVAVCPPHPGPLLLACSSSKAVRQGAMANGACALRGGARGPLLCLCPYPLQLPPPRWPWQAGGGTGGLLGSEPWLRAGARARWLGHGK